MMHPPPPPAFVRRVLSSSVQSKLLTLVIPVAPAASASGASAGDGGGGVRRDGAAGGGAGGAGLGMRLLLGMKKRGFGAGYYNGFGGKVEEGETVLQGAMRELEEEAGIIGKDPVEVGLLTFIFDDGCPEDETNEAVKHGHVGHDGGGSSVKKEEEAETPVEGGNDGDMISAAGASGVVGVAAGGKAAAAGQPVPWQVHVFRVTEFEGTPQESEEMRPEWFHQDDIPYPRMWADDVHWYPEFLKGCTSSIMGLQIDKGRQVQQVEEGEEGDRGPSGTNGMKTTVAAAAGTGTGTEAGRVFAGIFAFRNTTELVWHQMRTNGDGTESSISGCVEGTDGGGGAGSPQAPLLQLTPGDSILSMTPEAWLTELSERGSRIPWSG